MPALVNPLESHFLLKMREKLATAYNEYQDAIARLSRVSIHDVNYRDLLIDMRMAEIKVNGLKMDVKNEADRLCEVAIGALNKERKAFNASIDSNFEI